MLNNELKLPIFGRRKTPRLFLLPFSEKFPPISGVQLIWENKKVSSIFDISSSGIVVSSQNVLSRFKVGQGYEVKIRFDPIFEMKDQRVELRVMKLSAQAVYLSMDSLSSNGRLNISPSCRDDLIAQNMRNLTSWIDQIPLFPFHSWWHGPFDSNLFIEYSQNSTESLPIESRIEKTKAMSILQVRFEFEDLQAVWKNQNTEYKKSQSVEEDIKHYWSSVLSPSPQKVFPGVSWKSRSTFLIQSLSLPLHEKEYILKSLSQNMDL